MFCTLNLKMLYISYISIILGEKKTTLTKNKNEINKDRKILTLDIKRNK